ncbi:HNH endonuclease [Glycomyces sp. NPDC049804]|uniref:HNH endonuclease signature motif containing protein n=1 Tax=Glycomyces sp. NPDC049804 TaxID=3154363 RepID=UPI0034136DCB
MSSCTHTPGSRRAAAIRSALDDAASLINAQHAQVLAAVIEMKEQGLHRSVFGFSALRDLLVSQFDFHNRTAADIAAIARLSGKFRLLAQAAVSGAARIDQVAYAVRQLEQTPAMRLFARTPFQTPAPSPFDASVVCATPEAIVAQYCAHATFTELRRHLDELWASIAEESELFDELGEQSMQRLELTPQANGMWALEGQLCEATGRLLDKYLQTACPPPRQEDQEEEGLLPAQANRHAEAFHQLLAGYGSSPRAATRHGHTATLDLTVDIETLQGKDTGRLPLLEGQPISVARARLLVCEAGVIPSVFNYQTGEAVELGRALRLPNAALRRKLELEQPEGCAWQGCDRPVAWTEAHHIQHWADGGPTVAENLILLCRFHHGRIHTPGWRVGKTGPGQAVITHHEGHDGQGGNDSEGCGCSDWRTDADMDAENEGTEWEVFPTGLYRTEWSEAMKPDLDALAEAIERDRCLAAIKAAKAKCREKFRASAPVPVLGCPSGRLLGGKRSKHQSAQPDPHGFGPLRMPRAGIPPRHTPSCRCRLNRNPFQAESRAPTQRQWHLVVAARLNRRDLPPESRGAAQRQWHLVVAARLNRNPIQPGSRGVARAQWDLVVAARLNGHPPRPENRAPSQRDQTPLSLSVRTSAGSDRKTERDRSPPPHRRRRPIAAWTRRATRPAAAPRGMRPA